MSIRWGRIILGFVILVFACVVVTYLVLVGSGIDFDTDSSDPAGDIVGQVEEWASGGDGDTHAPTADDADSADGGGARPGAVAADRPGDAGGAGGTDLEPFRVLTLQYTPYMATLALMDASGYMEEWGYDLQLFDVYSDDVDLDEDGQCAALKLGDYDALATTLDATRKCGEGVAIGLPIGQSAGNDAIVVKEGVETWNDVFEHAVAFTGFSVSEYMACFASHTANEPMRLPLRFDDAPEAVDEWANAGAEQNILSVVAWEPEVSRALSSEAAPGSRVILSSRDVRILWDVVEFSTQGVTNDPVPYSVFTEAYYRALLDLSRDPERAFSAIMAWAGDDEDRLALLTTTDVDEFTADLGNEAFATLRDAAVLMDERQTFVNRLEEAEFYWEYCDVDVPEIGDESNLLLPEFVLVARQDGSLLGAPGERPSEPAFQISDFTDASVVTDEQIAQASVIFATGVDIEFLPNRTDFRDPGAATQTLSNAVRFLRTCQDCVLEVQGGAAYPGQRVCPNCLPEESDQLAVDRGRRVYDELRLRFDVPDAQLGFVEAPHTPQFPGSNDEQELRQDRRTFLTGYQLSGR